MKHKFFVDGTLYKITFRKHAAMIICTLHEHYLGNEVAKASATCSPYDAMLIGMQYGLREGMRQFKKKGEMMALTRLLDKTFSRRNRMEAWSQILPEYHKGMGRI